MRTIFNHEDILNFLKKHKDELVADEIISRTTLNPQGADITSMFDMMNHIYNMGRTHGVLEGKSEFMLQVMDFFEARES